MQTDIQSHGFSLTNSINQYTKRRLHQSVKFADEHIRRVTVRLSDTNGPRGGVDKSCQLMLTLARMPTVVIEEISHDLYAAIDGATERASQALARQIQRKRAQLSRKHGHVADADLKECSGLIQQA